MPQCGPECPGKEKKNREFADQDVGFLSPILDLQSPAAGFSALRSFEISFDCMCGKVAGVCLSRHQRVASISLAD
jgi:hypothetical protein